MEYGVRAKRPALGPKQTVFGFDSNCDTRISSVIKLKVEPVLLNQILSQNIDVQAFLGEAITISQIAFKVVKWV